MPRRKLTNTNAALDSLFKAHRAEASRGKVSRKADEYNGGLGALLGLVGSRKDEARIRALDFFSNIAARTGYGSPNLSESAEYPLVRLTFSYWQLISLYEGSWIPRRIVDVPAQDMIRAWPELTSDMDPKDLVKIDRVLRRTNAKNNLLTAMQWARLFGGAGALTSGVAVAAAGCCLILGTLLMEPGRSTPGPGAAMFV